MWQIGLQRRTYRLVCINKQLQLNINGCYLPETPKDTMNCYSPHENGRQMQYVGGTAKNIFCKV
jgi:hypothetical protein